MLYIKLRETKHIILCYQTFCPLRSPRPLGWTQNVMFFFSESNQVAYQINGMKHKTACK